MIVKVQTPLMRTGPVALALIYDERRTFQHMEPITDELLKLMEGQPKAFFHAEIKETKIVLKNKAKWQYW